ncbi:MAG: GNAT family N-acetyltransferase [Candidatus Dormibacteria bacterium]|jgi:RimJ/RimL family protein N-acetyltransferase
MAELADRIKIEPLMSRRFTLDPLRVKHAREMASILGDPSIYGFISGPPMTPKQVKSLYKRLEAGSPDPGVTWLNWVLRSRDRHDLVGTVQATVWPDQGRAEVAWIVGAAWQGQGIASEAAEQVVRWLERQEIRLVIAHIHPDHGASQAVARHLGLAPTGKVVDGEIEWRAGQA